MKSQKKLSTASSRPAKGNRRNQGAIWEDKWVPTCCFACVHWPCLIRVRIVNGVAVNVEGNAEDPRFVELTPGRGRTCPKPYGFIQKLYNPYRIKSPMKRTNPQKGRGVDPKWVEISWDEALDTIAQELRRIRADDTRKVLFIHGGPHSRGMTGTREAFWKAFGHVISWGTGNAIKCNLADHIFGNLIHSAYKCEPDAVYCNYLIFMGMNSRGSGGVGENAQHNDSQARGMKIVVIDPVLTATAAKADEWIPIKPGTDLALQLAWINVILNEIGIIDTDFLKNMTNSPYLVGPDGYFVRDKRTDKVLVWDPVEAKAKTYDDNTIKDFALDGVYVVEGVECRPALQVLKEHVRQYTPEWASSITEIPTGTIRRIAREWVDNARIGSTINIGGVSLPYRPVAAKLGRGLSANSRAYQNSLCYHILAALVGALETVGGHCGGRADQRGTQYRGVNLGADGMMRLNTHPFTWPPDAYDMNKSLLPYSAVMGHPMPHLGYLNLAEPPTDFPILAPLPEIAILHRGNPVLAIGEPELVAKGLCRIPLFVSIAYVVDETTELADIVLPDNTEFEHYDLADANVPLLSKWQGVTALRQPVVEPLHNTMDISDISTELADRAGFLDDYNMAINEGLKEPYKLEKGKKYAWVDILDRQCKSLTEGAHDLEWFKRNGAIVEHISPERQYSVHQAMVAKKVRYPIPYMEHVKKTGEELAQNLAKVGVDWWPTFEFVPLPIWVPSILEEVSPEYDFYVCTAREIQWSWGANVDLPWLIEVGHHSLDQQGIVMHKRAAEAKGIRDGDQIWVESEVGKVKGAVKLIEGIRPDTILMLGQFGQWSTPIARDTGRVSMTPLTPLRYSWIDPLVTSMQGNTVKAKVYKA